MCFRESCGGLKDGSPALDFVEVGGAEFNDILSEHVVGAHGCAGFAVEFLDANADGVEKAGVYFDDGVFLADGKDPAADGGDAFGFVRT